jgi:hypothetical protein
MGVKSADDDERDLPFSERNVGVVSIFSRGCSGSCTLRVYDATLERAGCRSRTPTDYYADPNKVWRELRD